MVTNHTSFIRIKTSHSTGPSIVLPVQVEVADSSGLFLSREILDFGILKSGGTIHIPIFFLSLSTLLSIFFYLVDNMLENRTRGEDEHMKT